MRTRWLQQRGNERLLLLFGGWAIGAAPFAALQTEADVLFVDDYRDLATPLPMLQSYGTVDLLAFSFGVASFAHWYADQRPTLRSKTAVSGTLTPADVRTGIAPEMVQATADGLSTDSFARFCRRAGLRGTPPELDIAARRTELLEIAKRGAAPDPGFDRIWLPSRDRIIPTQAQRTAWQVQAAVLQEIDAQHLPFQPHERWEQWVN